MRMEGKAEKKVPGGKLVKVAISFNTQKIESVKITGDFFLHPEDTIINIEKSLKNSRINSTEAELSKKINSAISLNNAQLLGINAEAIAQTILEALQYASNT